MEYIVGRRVALPGSVSPYAVSLSQCGVVAAVTLQGVHLFEIVSAVDRKEAFQFFKRTITPPVEINPLLDAEGQNRLILNRDIHFKEIHDIFLDRTLSPSRVTDEPLNTAFRTPVAWSPIGLVQDRRCLLVTVTTDHRVQLFRRGRECWQEVEQLSNLLTQHVDPSDWPDSSLIEGHHSEIFTAHKTASYLRATIAAAWSPLYQRTEGHFALLVTLQRSGHIAVWKIERTNKSPKIIFAGFHDLQMKEPSTLQLHPSTGQLLLFVGSHHGVVNCWSISWTDEAKTTCHLLGSVIAEPDEIPVNVIDIDTVDNRLVVCIVKQHVIVASVIQCDANGLEMMDQQSVLLPTLRITGFTRIANGNAICMMEDYSLCGINLKTDDKGLFTCLNAVPATKLPCSPTTMLCRGFSAPSNCSTLFVLEHIKVPFNHLQCREPTNLVVYVHSNMNAVVELLTHSRKMDTETLLALESYKALYGGDCEAISEYNSEDPLATADLFSLHLMRWFALYKANCCAADRRVDRETQTELELRGEKVEIVLQLRHIKATLAALLLKWQSIKQLTDNERMEVGLAEQFLAHECTADADFLPVVQDIKKQIANMSGIEIKDESCVICQEPIVFERRLDGSCSNGHGAYRCRATLVTCFDVMRTCRGCGAFYNLDAGLGECILCGGLFG